jgi:hypothetical protein
MRTSPGYRATTSPLTTCDDCSRTYNDEICQNGCPASQDYSEVTSP